MPSAAPARMFARVPYFNGQGQLRLRIVAVPLVAALVEPGSRYSIDDPRDPPPAPPRRTPLPKPPPSSSHRAGGPRKVFHVQRPEHDPFVERLLADGIDAPLK